MKHRFSILIAAVTAAAMLVSSAAILAQNSTPEPTAESTSAPSNFADGRINGNIQLAGLAIYCHDETGNTHVNTFQNGGITLWGVGDLEYISLTADQLRGTQEIPQPQLTEEPSMTEAAPMMATEAATMEPGMTEEPMAPVLLARTMTPTGGVWMYRTGTDQFALQGFDEHSKFFTYTWTGCSQGSISTTTAPFSPDVEVMMTPEATEMMTPEVTASS